MAVLPQRARRNIRRIHATFTGFYTVIAGLCLAAPIICVNYELIFQSGLLGFTVGIAFLMISAMMIGKEICLTRGEFYILRRHIISIVFCALASIIFTSFYIWNIVNILSMCHHSHEPTNHAGLLSIASEENTFHSTTIEEDQLFQVARAAKICRNEEGFGIFLAVFLILIVILNIITIGVYLWINSWLRCLPLGVIS